MMGKRKKKDESSPTLQLTQMGGPSDSCSRLFINMNMLAMRLINAEYGFHLVESLLGNTLGTAFYPENFIQKEYYQQKTYTLVITIGAQPTGINITAGSIFHVQVGQSNSSTSGCPKMEIGWRRERGLRSRQSKVARKSSH